eukprot:scaffold18427_cov77-Skeletonema_dohrnii-CCMP3373.AAC.2
MGVQYGRDPKQDMMRHHLGDANPNIMMACVRAQLAQRAKEDGYTYQARLGGVCRRHGARSYTNYAAVNDAQIMLSNEECACGMGKAKARLF